MMYERKLEAASYPVKLDHSKKQEKKLRRRKKAGYCIMQDIEGSHDVFCSQGRSGYDMIRCTFSLAYMAAVWTIDVRGQDKE